jgi:hypothetical protein
MPEAAVREYNLAAPRKDDVRPARQIFTMQPESVPEPMDQSPQGNFRAGILAANTPHICTASFGADFIHRGSLRRPLDYWQFRALAQLGLRHTS